MPFGVLAVWVLVWLWPLGLGGRMPVGGDVTTFSIGLMAEYQRALHGLRIPFWNANWGFGFPGLAESQMGVYYPPHWVLYGLLALEQAFTSSLVLHSIWAAWGAYWAARQFGASRAGAVLAGVVFSSCGFFVIHITHPWGYTTGSWMPWAWGLAWSAAHAGGSRSAWLLLTAVLAIQVLPGHFQLAFITQVTVVLLVLWGWLDCGAATRRAWWGLTACMLVLAGAAMLAALQLAPTWELAQRASQDRTYEYLSGFAVSPLHLVSYVAPGLFHRSPLWRPIVWDPFHTSPEEHLGYVGLLPLWLAFSVVAREWRTVSAVRGLAAVLLVTLMLSLGPYVPGFRALVLLPGFGFFRAPARWGLATMLVLSLLAALGLDRMADWARARASLLRFVAGAGLLVLLCVGLVEGALAVGGNREFAELRRVCDQVLGWLPWDERTSLESIARETGRPASNPIAQAGLNRRSEPLSATFRETRGRIYAEELGPLVFLFAALAVCGVCLGRRLPDASRHDEVGGNDRVSTAQSYGACWIARIRDPTFVSAALSVFVVLIDLGILSRQREVDSGPIESLVAQSPVLERLGESASETGGRAVVAMGNLPLVANAAPITTYRTLDVPAVPRLVAQVMQENSWDHEGFGGARARGQLMRILGANLRVMPPRPGNVSAGSSESRPIDLVEVEDLTLARWLDGPGAPSTRGGKASTFGLVRLKGEVTRAWLVWGRVPVVPAGSAAVPSEWPDAFWEQARGLSWSAATPEQFRTEEVEIDGETNESGGSVIVSQLYDPNWRAEWRGAGRRVAAEVQPSLIEMGGAGWMRVETPGAGRWSLHMRYEPMTAYVGLGVSAMGWLIWVAVWFEPWKQWRARTRSHASHGAVSP